MSHLFRFCGQRLAKLVHQGRNPTLPYQALLTRKSARLFSGFAPWCLKAFSAHPPTTISGGPPLLTLLILLDRLPVELTQSAGCRPAAAGRGDDLPRSAPAPPPADAPR